MYESMQAFSARFDCMGNTTEQETSRTASVSPNHNVQIIKIIIMRSQLDNVSDTAIRMREACSSRQSNNKKRVGGEEDGGHSWMVGGGGWGA